MNCKTRNCEEDCEHYYDPTDCPLYKKRTTLFESPISKEISGPDHYTHGKVECWNWYEMAMTPEEFRGAMKNNIWKYTFRSGHKDPIVKDLRKAIAYLERWIKYEEGWRHRATQYQDTTHTK